MSEEKLCSKTTRERDQLGWISGFLRRKKRPPQEVKNGHNSSEDSRLMRRNRAKNLHWYFSEIMIKLKHAIRKEKPQHDKRLFGKKKSFQRSLSTKDHFFLERMTSITQKRSHQEHDYDYEKHLSEMLRDQTRIVSLPEYSSPFSSPGRIWDQNSTVLSRSPPHDFIKYSETIADDSSSEGSSPFIPENNQIGSHEMSKVEAYGGGEKEGEILEETMSLLSVASLPSHCTSKTEEYELLLDQPQFIEYEINRARGEAKIQPLSNQLQEKNKESVFMYVKAVLDAIDSNWEELCLKTEFSDRLLYPALISKIPFYPNQLCVDHELLFDCINEVLFEFCRFPQGVISFVKPRTQVLSFSVESIIGEVQEKVYRHLLPMQHPQPLDQIVRKDMAKPRSWLDTSCDLECIDFETSELILNELLEELMLEL